MIEKYFGISFMPVPSHLEGLFCGLTYINLTDIKSYARNFIYFSFKQKNDLSTYSTVVDFAILSHFESLIVIELDDLL